MSLSTEAKLAIQELLSRAAYGLDERVEDVLAACFAEDAEFSLRIAGGDIVGPFIGREGIMTLMTDSFEQQTDQRRHIVSNIFFESCSDQKATVISNLTLFGTENGEIRLITAGVYKDEVVNNDGEWRLYRRHLNLDLPY